MKLQIKCLLKLKVPGTDAVDLIEDVNIVELPDDVSEADFMKAFDKLRMDTIKKHIIVELSEIK